MSGTHFHIDGSCDFGLSRFNQIVHAAGSDGLVMLYAGPELGFLGQQVLANVLRGFQRILTRANINILFILV